MKSAIKQTARTVTSAGDLIRALHFRSIEEFYKSGREIDAVMTSTSPAHWMDVMRAEEMVNAIENLYGNLQDYEGPWIVAGWLGGLPYEKSQRKDIVDTLLKRGVSSDKILAIDGKDTTDKVRELAKLVKDSGKIRSVAISSYPLHIARFALNANYAQRQNVLPKDFEIVGIRNSYERTPEDARIRPVGDVLYGTLAMMKDLYRLNNSEGFNGATPDYRPLERIVGKMRNANSEEN